MIWSSVDTPLGPFVMVRSAVGLVAASFEPDAPAYLDRTERALGQALAKNDAKLAEPRREVQSYFARTGRGFVTPIDFPLVRGPFSRNVLEVARKIPYGSIATYGDVAAMAGSRRAARAAGTALRNCPFELFVPCHRIVPAAAGLGRYGGHPDRREFLLRLEGAI
jgi:methylated-DNA-[protein]-cysteine S-methyltransferase